jgi:3-oxoacyl-(acyl-carrier-protein) synthase
LSGASVYISGMGVISSLGCGVAETADALTQARRALKPVTLFAVKADAPLAVGEVKLGHDPSDPLPRTHRLARIAADQALADTTLAPDAIVVGTTTGGMLTTEALLEKCVSDPECYRYHGAASIAEELAGRYGCNGPLITVSTACSSGAAALLLAMEMLRGGKARRVLAGGVDSLCRLTYFGFKSLQLIDPGGARPFDRERRGLSVAEGAAFLLLTTDPPARDAVQLLGAALSCDAHHATAPLSDGQGALAAMRAALADAGLAPSAIDYINLHGTGTPDNDLVEARAVRALFGDRPPPLSSIKGATGHTLAAAGAIEAVVSAISIDCGIVPANVGFGSGDPALGMEPVTSPRCSTINTVLSNSFGFGGNNATVIIGARRGPNHGSSGPLPRPLTVTGAACVSGAGHTGETWESFCGGRQCCGRLDDLAISEGLPPRMVRRLKRLPRLALALASQACRAVSSGRLPVAVSLGTAWGPLSETHDFLRRLFEAGEQFPSPTDFIGSVHNAPAGQIAMLLGAKGANVTTSGGDASFEQALLAADLLARSDNGPVLVLGVDEGHPVLAPLFDGSVRTVEAMADGGGALVLERGENRGGPTVSLLEYRFRLETDCMAGLVERLGGADGVGRDYGAILVGLPARGHAHASEQLASFVSRSRFDGPVIDYRRIVGQFGAASAVAAVLAVKMVEVGLVSAPLASGSYIPLNGKGILVLGLGKYLSALRVASQ